MEEAALRNLLHKFTSCLILQISRQTSLSYFYVGIAYPYEQYKDDCPSWDAIQTSQEYTKFNKIGLWSGDYQKPWEYPRRGSEFVDGLILENDSSIR